MPINYGPIRQQLPQISNVSRPEKNCADFLDVPSTHPPSGSLSQPERGDPTNPASCEGRPAYIPLAVWFAFLLRADVRAGRSTDDPEALKDFVCWWLIAGRDEYPAVWGVTPELVEIAMKPVAVPFGEMPRLLWFLWSIRLDLQAEFKLDGDETLASFFCWYRLVGGTQLNYAPPLPERFLTKTEAMPDYFRPQGTPLPRMALMMLRLSPNLALTANLGSPAGRQRLADFYHQQGQSLIPVAPPVPGPPLEPRPTPVLYPGTRVGINLIGFARSEFGLGEDVRMTSAALEAAGIEHVVIDMADESPSVARRNDRRLDPLLAERPVHPISVFCMSPFDAATLWLRRGNDLFDGRYLVGYWVWELPQLPKIWHEAALLVDEIWAPSRFATNSLAAQSIRYVRHLPAFVELESVPRLSRSRLELPEGKYLFICLFDPNSSLKRKNPVGAVRAFRRAFPQRRKDANEVGLVLRVNGETGGPGWDEVAAAIGNDRRIFVVEGTMDRERALAFLAASDCLVSLHRAEGYGRNIAEAKRLAVSVIATGFSGCMDFLSPDECVDFSVAPVGDDYPFGRGQIWAEPDINQAVEKMRATFASSRADKLSRKVGA